jgi:hypothetical protein
MDRVIYHLTYKNLDNSYFSLKLKRASYGWNSRYAVNGKLWKDSGYATNGKLWKAKKDISDEELPVFSFRISDTIHLLKP